MVCMVALLDLLDDDRLFGVFGGSHGYSLFRLGLAHVLLERGREIVQVGQKWYLFYHDTQLSGKTHLRNVKVTELKFNADGSIQTIQPLKK